VGVGSRCRIAQRAGNDYPPPPRERLPNNQVHQLDGVVDQNSQLALWKVSDNINSPIMAAGLFNFTQVVVPVQVHFSDGSNQTWVLVRLQQ